MIQNFTYYSYIKETYRKEDFELLKKFNADNKDKYSFHENFTRFETTKETIKQMPKIISQEEFYGKATRRILENIEKDPAYINGEKEFVKKIAEKMRKRWADSMIIITRK